ncbi:PREDICTED: protein phyllopod [Rhagoletis zephyria]|uniref:protein phyllopod n=1 Tax=Rhagoletis zephyria TaxID=28612 RepID=UPI00081168C1|nr:PREDICTED: protein phyllopod [Rhagoletis zephyria]
MSEKASEYLKRTCLICGCHTNQTINIYEPRNGPNIVELIQAKFKFQPLNEDKYLCFSCNNWLINWHSLQASNSNDAESPSGTFRPQMNSMFHKEKAKNPRQQTQPSHMHCQKNYQLCRPTAKVRPWRITEKAHNEINWKRQVLKKQKAFTGKSKWILKLQRKYHENRRISLRNVRLRRSLRQCNTYNFYLFSHNSKPNKLSFATFVQKLKKQRYIGEEYIKKVKQNQECWDPGVYQKSSPGDNNNAISELNEKTSVNNYDKQCLKRPLLDGKVISMLRRLGTTLSLENRDASAKASTPLHRRIMNPVKSKPQWKSQLNEDEILLGFDSAISEVLPQVIQQRQQKVNGNNCVPEIFAVMQAKRKLAYQVSFGKDDSQYVYPRLPEGLSISLV